MHTSFFPALLAALLFLGSVNNPAEADTTNFNQGGFDMTHEDKGIWEKTKDGAAKAWDKTKEVSGDAWDATKEGTEKAWDKTKEMSGNAWDKTKEVSSNALDATKEKAEDVKEHFSSDENPEHPIYDKNNASHSESAHMN